MSTSPAASFANSHWCTTFCIPESLVFLIKNCPCPQIWLLKSKVSLLKLWRDRGERELENYSKRVWRDTGTLCWLHSESRLWVPAATFWKVNPAQAEISGFQLWFLVGRSWSGVPKSGTLPVAHFSHHENWEFSGHLFQPLGQCVMILLPPPSKPWSYPARATLRGWQAGFLSSCEFKGNNEMSPV